MKVETTQAGAALRARIDAESGALVRAVCAGRDTAPARRARLEGLIAAAVAAGVPPAVLRQQLCAQLPPGSSVVIEDDTDGVAVRLHLWQRRAPVRPSTAD